MILIIDDDHAVTASLALLLKQAGFASTAATSPDEAIEVLRRQPCQLVIQDMNFSRRTSGEEGLALLQRIKALTPALPVVLITAWGSINLAVEGMKAGAADFVTKPWTNTQMLETVKTTLGLAASRATAEEHATSRDDLDARFDFGALVGRDPKMLRVLQLIGRVAATQASVLITGESGTGKELIAEALHRNSTRANRAFVKVNLGGISSSLFESEMFGHVRGAFTDARHDRKGRFEMASGGTIFLDEIGDLDPASQVKLLRVLQDRTFEVLGSSQRRTVDVRVVAATNRSLPEMVQRGEFREDLLYRINLITLHLPSLRERRDDIRILASRFVQAVGEAYDRASARLTEDALRYLVAQPWPGNIRQLRQAIERTMLMSGTSVLDAAAFKQTMDVQPAEAERDVLPPVGSMTIDEIEKAMILKSMKHHAGNISKVAQALGLSRAALYRRLEKYEIPV